MIDTRCFLEVPVGRVRVGVFDEHEIFRLGVVACLAEDATIVAVSGAPEDASRADLDLAIVSPSVAAHHAFACGVLICADDPSALPIASRDTVLGVLPRAALTAPQLRAAVLAAVAGLSVGLFDGALGHAGLDRRRREVLRLLAEGASTVEISRRLHCSERTVKTAISDLKRRLRARNRAHVVAAGIRQGMI